jgi:RimK family alpha-L-glutamate ligase
LRLAFQQQAYDSVYISLTACRLQLNAKSLPVYLPEFETQWPTAAFVRGVPGGTLEEVTFYLAILHALKRCGVPVYNDAAAIERSVDKGMTSFLLQQAGLPTPATWVLRDRESALRVIETELKQGFSVVSKPLFGSQGEGLRRFQKSTDLLWLTPSHGIYYLQRFVDCMGTDYADIRAFVVNGQVIAAMQRCGGKSWLNNVARGARCQAIEIQPLLAQRAIAATAALSMDYAGVDLIQTVDGDYMIIEVNSVPAWKGLESVCQFSLAERLVEDLIQRYLSGR